jgi:hypothetical protein
MIKELFQFLHYKSTNFKVSNDHLRESIALQERRKRNINEWKNHESKCHQLIIDFLSQNKNAKKILILGSGILHEIPINHPIFSDKEIYLVDVVHLYSVRRKNKNNKCIHFIEHEITETEELIIKKKKLISVMPKSFIGDSFDLVISANIISQLPIHLSHLILKNGIESDHIKIKSFTDELINNHILYLKEFNIPALIIFDKESIYRDKEGKIIESHITVDASAFSNLLEHKNEWIWNIAPIPELNPNYSMELKIATYVINKTRF